MVQADFSPKEFIPVTCGIDAIEAKSGFEQLEEREALYAYYMARASWDGAKICWFQRSYESPALLVLFKLIFAQGLEKAQADALAAGVTELEFKQMKIYAAATFQNCGNFKSFGDTKFVPELHPDKFKAIVQSSAAYKTHKEVIDTIMERIYLELYKESDPHGHIGFKDDNGVSSYYSGNVTKDDIKFIDDFCQKQKISPLNTRLLKSADGNTYDLLVCSRDASKEKTGYLGVYQEEGGKTVNVTAGDFSEFMAQVVESMQQAKFYTSDENQAKMIENYAEHFKYGDMDVHKDSQRNWIKDKGPIVETNIGFIETYLDPSGARAEFEGFVAIVNKQTSAHFNELVRQAEDLIDKLPWSRDFEKETFLKPDFTDLEVVAFGCSGTPIGINIPNYDDIRQHEGFKNVNLGNVYGRPKKENIKFLGEEDKDITVKYSKESLTLIVALHELLGHGTGKLWQLDEQGNKNWNPEVKNPFTGEEITTCYTATETWGQKFGKLHSGYEECRADSVALYLIQFAEPFKIFLEGRDSEWDDIYYTCWLDMLYSAVKGLRFYDEEKKLWGQAHILAAWVILSAVREGDPQLVTFDFHEKDGKDWFTMKVDRSRIREHGFKALSDFLHKLHVYKSIGDYDTAEKFFNHYSEVDETMLRVRKIVMDNKTPRPLELQPNLMLVPSEGGQQKVVYKGYESTMDGIIQSYLDRWQGAFMRDVYDEWLKYAPRIRTQ